MSIISSGQFRCIQSNRAQQDVLQDHNLSHQKLSQTHKLKDDFHAIFESKNMCKSQCKYLNLKDAKILTKTEAYIKFSAQTFKITYSHKMIPLKESSKPLYPVLYATNFFIELGRNNFLRSNTLQVRNIELEYIELFDEYSCNEFCKYNKQIISKPIWITLFGIKKMHVFKYHDNCNDPLLLSWPSYSAIIDTKQFEKLFKYCNNYCDIYYKRLDYKSKQSIIYHIYYNYNKSVIDISISKSLDTMANIIAEGNSISILIGNDNNINNNILLIELLQCWASYNSFIKYYLRYFNYTLVMEYSILNLDIIMYILSNIFTILPINLDTNTYIESLLKHDDFNINYNTYESKEYFMNIQTQDEINISFIHEFGIMANNYKTAKFNLYLDQNQYIGYEIYLLCGFINHNDNSKNSPSAVSDTSLANISKSSTLKNYLMTLDLMNSIPITQLNIEDYNILSSSLLSSTSSSMRAQTSLFLSLLSYFFIYELKCLSMDIFKRFDPKLLGFDLREEMNKQQCNKNTLNTIGNLFELNLQTKIEGLNMILFQNIIPIINVSEDVQNPGLYLHTTLLNCNHQDMICIAQENYINLLNDMINVLEKQYNICITKKTYNTYQYVSIHLPKLIQIIKNILTNHSDIILDSITNHLELNNINFILNELDLGEDMITKNISNILRAALLKTKL